MSSAVPLLATSKTKTTLKLSQPPESRWDRYAVIAMALTAGISAVLWAFFVEIHLGLDDIGLFNPVYMYLHSGKVTYPTYNFFRVMVVHPPTHYFILGWLARRGIPLAYVPSIPPFLIILLTIWLISTSRFPSGVKIGLLFGLIGGTLLPWSGFTGSAFSFSFRPDLHVAFAWFAGLIGLETARLDEWNPRRLFLGSLLLTYASTLHYVESIAWLGVLVYAAWLLRARGKRNIRKPLLAMAAGGCLVGIPYLAFFVIPCWSVAMPFISSAKAFGGVAACVHAQFVCYRLIYYSLAQQTVLRILFFSLAAGVPVILFYTITLWVERSTRGIVLASYPLTLVLLLAVERKLTPTYLFPEFILYVSGLAIFAIWLAQKIANYIGPRARMLVVPASCLILAPTLLMGTNWLSQVRLNLHPRVLELDVARAAGRQILGSNALVGARLARFYTSGGDMSYMLSPDLLWGKIGDLNVESYFANFDAVAEDSFGSAATANERHESLSSWYADGTLKLRGFYFSSLNQDLSYLLLTAHKNPEVAGYGRLPDGRIVHFRENDQRGQFLFVAASCPVSSVDLIEVHPLFHNIYLLPTAERSGAPTSELLTFVAPREIYYSFRPQIISKCSIRDEIRLDEELLSVGQLLATLSNDQTIRFYERLDDALDARYGPLANADIGADGWPASLTFVRGPLKGKTYTMSGARTLFRSDMDDRHGWYFWGKTARVNMLSNGLRPRDHSIRFFSGTGSDSVTTRFSQTSPGQTGLAFFSVWVKALDGPPNPHVFLQNRSFVQLAEAHVVAHKNDGWFLMAGWTDKPASQQVRIAIQQDPRTASLLDKLYIAEFPRPN